jgi:hypothetical protein
MSCTATGKPKEGGRYDATACQYSLSGAGYSYGHVLTSFLGTLLIRWCRWVEKCGMFLQCLMKKLVSDGVVLCGKITIIVHV